MNQRGSSGEDVQTKVAGYPSMAIIVITVTRVGDMMQVAKKVGSTIREGLH